MFFQFACFLTQVFEVLFGNRQVLGKRGMYQSLYESINWSLVVVNAGA